MNIDGFPQHELRLKVGVPVILLRDVNQSIGLCSGARMVVLMLGERIVEAEIIAGSHAGQRVFVPQIVLDNVCSQWSFTLSRFQFPVQSWGQSLSRTCIYRRWPAASCDGRRWPVVSPAAWRVGFKSFSCDDDGVSTIGGTRLLF